MSAQIIKLPSTTRRRRKWASLNGGTGSNLSAQLQRLDNAIVVLKYNRAQVIKALNAEIWEKCRETSTGTAAMHRRHQRFVAKFDRQIEDLAAAVAAITTVEAATP
jgi:hypothetical protein